MDTDTFNVYQGQRYDGQSAAVGTNLGPPPAHWKSATGTKLEVLQKQQKSWNINYKHNKLIIASRPTDSTTTTSNASNAALLAAHLQFPDGCLVLLPMSVAFSGARYQPVGVPKGSCSRIEQGWNFRRELLEQVIQVGFQILAGQEEVGACALWR
jgi:hypothetical protein